MSLFTDMLWMGLAGLLAGVSIMFIIYFAYSKFSDLKTKRNVPDRSEMLVPEKKQINFEEVKEDERRNTERIRQFEKLRRLEQGNRITPRTDEFYERSFQQSKPSSVQHQDAIRPEQYRSSTTNNSCKPRVVKFDY